MFYTQNLPFSTPKSFRSLHQKFSFVLHQKFTFFTPKSFLSLHQKFSFVLHPKFSFFYTQNFPFLHPKFTFFTRKIYLFSHPKFSFFPPKIFLFYTKNFPFCYIKNFVFFYTTFLNLKTIFFFEKIGVKKQKIGGKKFLLDFGFSDSFFPFLTNISNVDQNFYYWPKYRL